MADVSNDVLILQHRPESPPGSVLDYLRGRNINYKIAASFDPTLDWASLGSYQNVIILGGAMNVDEEDEFPWLRSEKKFIQTGIIDQKRMMGLCLGAQLIAEALGSTVKACPHWEVGWHQLEWGKDLPIATPEPMSVFQWHGYCFNTPPNALSLGKTAGWGHQGYLANGGKLIGFQFHPEATPKWVEDCANTPELEWPEGPYVQDGAQIRAGAFQQVQLQTWFFGMLDYWLARR